MLNDRSLSIALILTIGLCSIVYFSGLSGVPFHPDEQTYLYMSGDFERLFTNPNQLYWNPSQSADIRQKYRLRDAPLARWMIGLGRQIGRTPAPEVDWDWSQDWQTNLAKGALPQARLLSLGRWSVAILFPFSLWLMFQIAKTAGGNLSGWVAMLALATNALILLHTRRAMAESGLIFSILLTLWSFQRFSHKPHWTAMATALAFNAKQSALPLVFLGWVNTLFSPSMTNISLSKRIQRAIQYGVIFACFTLALNPVLWSNPVRASFDAWQERILIVEDQVAAIRSVDPEMVWERYSQRASGLIVQLYFAKPAIADLANYITDTQEAENAYFSNPFHSLFRNPFGAALFLVINLFGFILAPFQARYESPLKKRYLFTLWLATVLQAVGLIFAVPLPFQRYVLALVPFVCLWSGLGIEGLIRLINMLSCQKQHSL